MPENPPNPGLDQIVGENLWKWRVARNIAPEQIAETLKRITPDITAQDVLDFESGKKRPLPTQLELIAEIYGRNVVDFFLQNNSDIAANDNTPQS